MNLTIKELEIILESLKNRMRKNKSIVGEKPQIYSAAEKINEEIINNSKNI